MKKWKRWLIKCAYLSCIAILASSYTTKTIGTMYIEELNKEYHISLPTNSFHVSGVSDNVYKPELGSIHDKLKIYSLITTKIPQGEIQKISSLVENGLTKEKLIEIQKILNQNLNEQEYSELMSIFSKY